MRHKLFPFLPQVVITKNVDQRRGIVHATSGILRGCEDANDSLDAQADEKYPTSKRPAWVVIGLTIGKGKGGVDKSPKVYTQLAQEGVVLTQDSDNI